MTEREREREREISMCIVKQIDIHLNTDKNIKETFRALHIPQLFEQNDYSRYYFTYRENTSHSNPTM